MMWPEVLRAYETLLIEDPGLAAELGTDSHGLVPVYQAQSSRPARVPSVEYTLPLFDLEEENFNPFDVQVDYWARGFEQAATIEFRIRALTHRDTARELGGYRLWTLYLDSRSHEYPADPGVYHRSLDIRFAPLRSKYQRAVS